MFLDNDRHKYQFTSKLSKLRRRALSWWYRNDLNRLALLFGTDKWGSHWYTQHYSRFFRGIRRDRLTLLEIGVGGFRNPLAGGESLRMWKAYFPKATIVSIDCHDKTHLSERRIDIRQCDQSDVEALRKLATEYGGFDIVIDDGSHVSEHVVTSFRTLFPHLHDNGIYVIEDTQTAYWPNWGGGLENPKSSMAFFKSLVDGLNHAEYPIVNYEPSYLDRNIVEVSFFHNLIFIRKGPNTEKTNVPSLLEQEILKLNPHPRTS